jgi:hypothetical protein
MARKFAASLFGLLMTLALSTAATADITVAQIGGDLFVVGSNKGDSVLAQREADFLCLSFGE